jgi:protein-disulfide isomerase
MQRPVLTLPVGERDHSYGAPDAPVTLVEYGDFQCPHCAMAHGIVEEVLHDAGSMMRFVYRHFPLASMHPQAAIAAEAAEAAAAQGKFWEMYDVLFLNQDALEPDDLIGYAGAIGLDTPRFVDDMERRVHAARVQEDLESGRRSGVDGTPAFFINGVRWEGPREVNFLLGAIRAAAAVSRT